MELWGSCGLVGVKLAGQKHQMPAWPPVDVSSLEAIPGPCWVCKAAAVEDRLVL